MKKYLPVLLITILALTLTGIKLYPTIAGALNKEETQKKQQLSNDSDEIAQETKHKNPLLDDDFPFKLEEQEKYAQENPDKFAIVEKMYYAWDYIDNAEGLYEYGNNGQVENRVTFHVDFEQKQNKALYETLENGSVVETEHFLLHDGQMTGRLDEQQIYYQEPVKNNPRQDDISALTDALGKDAGLIIGSEEWMVLFDNYDSWEYEETTAFGIPAFKIKGTLTKDTSEMLAGPFEMTVAKETGVLLDLQCYGEEDKEKPVYFIKVADISINDGIENAEEVFQLDVSDSEELPFEEYGKETYGAKAGGEKTGWD
ncbi:hypothetical protein ERJ70_06220 [Sediminibacillus dalangtanensis]|uniref:Uncharacterized protein n=1 Tax=Sediminibacillus dalangtanensis TaxID=2729421 RepID=A0ABX7VPS5_9BACI|nr:hypothetical protein [Sediminibacillus dalangtanensis]QTM98932.1 hypothetical protein ERJ70_06220 [Sediminibacillus dalangtanensis]